MLLRAFAKINLDLRVFGRRPDGYHEVRTTMQTVDLWDEIRIEAAEHFNFIARGAPAGEDNLVVKAVRAFERLTGAPAHVRIELLKRIPMGAGLGGGSADAAITLMGLTRFWGRPVSSIDQVHCLQQLGSDVPFFAFGGSALATGRGEQVALLDDDEEVRDAHLVIVSPAISISTAEAYSWLTMGPKSNSIEGFGVDSCSDSGRTNDFEVPVFARYPLLADIKRRLLASGAVRASLSGSGSAIFGVFKSYEDASGAARHFSGEMVAYITRPVTRQEYRDRTFDE